jgi:flagellar basal-body rod modification protein FlgD
MSSSVSALLGSAGAAAASGATNTTAAAGSGSSAPSEQVFLQLLVSQIQHQDPLNPSDSTQFVAQLAQFSELEQVIAIRTDIEKAGQAATTPGTGGNTPAGNIPVSTVPGTNSGSKVQEAI